MGGGGSSLRGGSVGGLLREGSRVSYRRLRSLEARRAEFKYQLCLLTSGLTVDASLNLSKPKFPWL